MAGTFRGGNFRALLGLGRSRPSAPLLFWLTLYPPHAFDETVYHLPMAASLGDHGEVRWLDNLRVPVFPQTAEAIGGALWVSVVPRRPIWSRRWLSRAAAFARGGTGERSGSPGAAASPPRPSPARRSSSTRRRLSMSICFSRSRSPWGPRGGAVPRRSRARAEAGSASRLSRRGLRRRSSTSASWARWRSWCSSRPPDRPVSRAAGWRPGRFPRRGRCGGGSNGALAVEDHGQSGVSFSPRRSSGPPGWPGAQERRHLGARIGTFLDAPLDRLRRSDAGRSPSPRLRLGCGSPWHGRDRVPNPWRRDGVSREDSRSGLRRRGPPRADSSCSSRGWGQGEAWIRATCFPRVRSSPSPSGVSSSARLVPTGLVSTVGRCRARPAGPGLWCLPALAARRPAPDRDRREAFLERQHEGLRAVRQAEAFSPRLYVLGNERLIGLGRGVALRRCRRPLAGSRDRSTS